MSAFIIQMIVMMLAGSKPSVWYTSDDFTSMAQGDKFYLAFLG